MWEMWKEIFLLAAAVTIAMAADYYLHNYLPAHTHTRQ
jgi:hypothetical protein